MTTLRLLATAASLMALTSVTCNAQQLAFDVCMGNGGGPSCADKNTIVYTCADYRAIGAGGPATLKALGERLCKVFKANGEQQQLDYNVAHISSVPGGECGWTRFHVTCIPPR